MSLDVTALTDGSGSTANDNSWIPIYYGGHKKIKLSDLPNASGVVTSVTGASPVTSSGGTTPEIGLNISAITSLTSLNELTVSGTGLILNASYPSGTENTAIGQNAFNSLGSGAAYNTAVGYEAGKDLTSGDWNSLFGHLSGADLTTSLGNTFIGNFSGYQETISGLNTYVGYSAGGFQTGNGTDGNNTFVGNQSGNGIGGSSTGTKNTAIGSRSLYKITTGTQNVGVGYYSGYKISTGDNNLAIGTNALLDLTTGSNNVAVGTSALQSMTGSYSIGIGAYTGQQSTAEVIAIGRNAGQAHTSGAENTLIGNSAGAKVGTDGGNTFIGYESGAADGGIQGSDPGRYNTAVGVRSCNIGNGYNTAVGYESMSNTDTDSRSARGNSALGYQALQYHEGSYNVAIGYSAMQGTSLASVSGDYNVAIGRDALERCTTGEFNVAIGYDAADDLTNSRDTVSIGMGVNKGSPGNSCIVIGDNAAGSTSYDLGAESVVIGKQAGHDSEAAFGVAVGSRAGENLGGNQNVAIGYQALLGHSTSSGTDNVGIGYRSGVNLTTGDNNVFIGEDAGSSVTSGGYNIAIGLQSGQEIASGEGNISIGYRSGYTLPDTTSKCISIGYQTGYSPPSSGNTDEILRIGSDYTGATPQTHEFIYGDMEDGFLNFNKLKTTGSQVKIQNTTPSGTGFEFLECVADSDGSPDVVFKVRGDGQVSVNGSEEHAGADYADMFEWADGNPDDEDRIGLSIVLDGEGFCRVATTDDNPGDIVGAVTGTANVVGNAAWSSWHNKFLKDDFGRTIEGSLNPDFDPEREYVPRQERAEWAVIGLTGRVHIRKGSSTHPSWRKIRNVSAVTEEWLVR